MYRYVSRAFQESREANNNWILFLYVRASKHILSILYRSGSTNFPQYLIWIHASRMGFIQRYDTTARRLLPDIQDSTISPRTHARTHPHPHPHPHLRYAKPFVSTAYPGTVFCHQYNVQVILDAFYVRSIDLNENEAISQTPKYTSRKTHRARGRHCWSTTPSDTQC